MILQITRKEDVLTISGPDFNLVFTGPEEQIKQNKRIAETIRDHYESLIRNDYVKRNEN